MSVPRAADEVGWYCSGAKDPENTCGFACWPTTQDRDLGGISSSMYYTMDDDPESTQRRSAVAHCGHDDRATYLASLQQYETRLPNCLPSVRGRDSSGVAAPEVLEKPLSKVPPSSRPPRWPCPGARLRLSTSQPPGHHACGFGYPRQLSSQPSHLLLCTLVLVLHVTSIPWGRVSHHACDRPNEQALPLTVLCGPP